MSSSTRISDEFHPVLKYLYNLHHEAFPYSAGTTFGNMDKLTISQRVDLNGGSHFACRDRINLVLSEAFSCVGNCSMFVGGQQLKIHAKEISILTEIPDSLIVGVEGIEMHATVMKLKNVEIILLNGAKLSVKFSEGFLFEGVKIKRAIIKDDVIYFINETEINSVEEAKAYFEKNSSDNFAEAEQKDLT